jgi:Protein of unknown function (DUF2484)
MTASLIAACVWAIAATITALLPMKRQMIPGVTLLATALPLLGWIGWDHGWVLATLGLLGFLSMMRNPLIYFVKRALGKPVELPRELQK